MDLLKDHLTKHREKAGVQPAKLTRLQEIDKKIAEIGQKQNRVEECTDPKICRLVENASPVHRQLRRHYTEDLIQAKKKAEAKAKNTQQHKNEREERPIRVVNYTSDENVATNPKSTILDKNKIPKFENNDHRISKINSQRSNAGHETYKGKTSAKAMLASAQSPELSEHSKTVSDNAAFFSDENETQIFLPGKPLNTKKCYVKDPNCVKDLFEIESEDEAKQDNDSDSDASDTVEELLKTAQIIARSHKTTRNLFDHCVTSFHNVADLESNYYKEVVDKKTNTRFQLDEPISLSSVTNRLKQKKDELMPPKAQKNRVSIVDPNDDQTVIWNQYTDKRK